MWLLPLISAIFVISLGLFVLSRDVQSKLNILFSLFCLSVSIWLFGTFMMFKVTADEEIIFWDRFIYIGVVFIPIFMHHFSLVFAKITTQRKLLKWGYFLAVLFLIASRTDYFVAGVFRYKWGCHTIAQPLHHIFLLVFWAYVVVLNYNVYRFYKRTASPIEKNQAKYVFLAFFVLFAVGACAYLPAYKIPIFPFPFVSGVLFAIILGYAVGKYNLLGIDVAIINILSQLIAISCLVVTVIFSVFGLANILNLDTNYFYILSTLGFMLIFYPFGKKLEQAINQYLRPRPDFDAILRDYTEVDMLAAHTSKGLADLVVRRIADSLKPTVCSLMLLDETTGLYNVIASSGKDEEINTIAFKATNHLILSLKNSHNIRLIVKDELNKIFPQEQADLIRRDLEILKCQISIPLLLHRELIGLVNLGAKTSGELYTPEEIGFLFVFLTQSAFMIRFLDKIHSLHELEVRAEKLAGMTNLLDGFDHEFRNQIIPGQSYMQLQDVSSLNEDMQKLRQYALSGFENILMILNAVRDYRESTDAKEISHTNIKETINFALLELKEKLASINVKITSNISDNLPEIETYPSFQYLFSNLLLNCYYALSQRKPRLLDIKAYQAKDPQRPIEIVIKDTGRNILEVMKKDVPSSGGKEFPERANLGGINYFLAKHIIEDHQGKLIVTTNPTAGPDGQKGTVFTIKLPLTQTKI